MNKKIKSVLAEYFEPPKPDKKEEFLNSLDLHAVGKSDMGKPDINKIYDNNLDTNKPGINKSYADKLDTNKSDIDKSDTKNRITYRGFVLSQIMYIRKWVWAVSVIFFAIVLFYSKYSDTDIIRLVSSFMPVLALAVVTESGRSETYGMAELEISARFSLRYVILARLLILGMANLIIVCLFLPFISKNSNEGGFITAICILYPYLLTSFLGLLFTRKIHGKESAYMCAGTAAIVSIGNITAYQMLPYIFETAYLAWWIILLILLIAGCVNELYKKLQMSEDLAWSLY